MNKKKLQSIVNIMNNTMRNTFSSFCCGFAFFCRFSLVKIKLLIRDKKLEKGIPISDRLLIRFNTSTRGVC